MFGNIGLMEIGIIALILLLLFGAKRIPILMGSIGEGIRELKNSFRSDEVEASASSDGSTPESRSADRIER